jgi:hypothetical protein
VITGAITVTCAKHNAPTRRQSINSNNMTSCDWDTLLVAFAAELTNAAYRVALQHGLADSWIDLELELWKVLSEMVREWGAAIAVGRIAGASDTTAATFGEESTHAKRNNHAYRRPGRPS